MPIRRGIIHFILRRTDPHYPATSSPLDLAVGIFIKLHQYRLPLHGVGMNLDLIYRFYFRPSAYTIKPSAFATVGVPNLPSAYENPVGVRCGGPHKTASDRSVSPHTPTTLPSASECRLFLFLKNLFSEFF